MKTFSVQANASDVQQATREWENKGIQLILLFSSRDILKDSDLIADLKNRFPDAELVGCSTSGEIGERVEDESVSLLGMVFDTAIVKSAAVEIKDVESSRAAGAELAQMLMEDDLAGLFVMLPGVGVNGSKFVTGVRDVLPGNISVSGGMAGDGLNFQETLTVYDGRVASRSAVAFGLYGSKVRIRSSAGGGWKPFGPVRRVTKAENNVLYELDGSPALDLYKQYLGDKAADLPSSGLLYPFAIMEQNKENAVGLIRTILDINEDTQSLVLAGNLETGQQVCLMHATTDELVDGAEAAAQIAGGDLLERESGAVICVSCVGRKILMGDDTEDELDAVRSVFESHNIAGFYSYGEICHFQDTQQPELHNQTMTVTFITEDAA